jgi:tRNA (cmo5U34)-methyltransferase
MRATDGAMKRDIGSGLAKSGSWTFAEGVADVFLEHVRQSVPSYDAAHDLACAISVLFTRPGGRGYDLGTSTGQLLLRLAEANTLIPDVEWIGYDCEPEMVAAAREACRSRKVTNATVELGDIAEVTYGLCDFVTACLVLQFLPVDRRKATVERIFCALRDGGAFFVFEKVHEKDVRIGNVIEVLYHDFKTSQGLRPSEVANKARTLATVLEPHTPKENLMMLRHAGFRSVAVVTRYLCYEGYLAVK